MTTQNADDVRTWGKDCFASTCPWCRCKGFHSEFCEGFEVNDPAASVAARNDGKVSET